MVKPHDGISVLIIRERDTRARRQPSASQEEGPHQELNQLASGSWISQPPEP